MVGGSDLVVAIGLDALHGVVWVVVELIQHQLVQLVVYGHGFLPGKKAFGPLVLLLFEPQVASYIFNTVTFFRIRVQDFLE